MSLIDRNPGNTVHEATRYEKTFCGRDSRYDASDALATLYVLILVVIVEDDSSRPLMTEMRTMSGMARGD